MTDKEKIEFLENLVLDLLDVAHNRVDAPKPHVLSGQWKFYLERTKD